MTEDPEIEFANPFPPAPAVVLPVLKLFSAAEPAPPPPPEGYGLVWPPPV